VRRLVRRTGSGRGEDRPAAALLYNGLGHYDQALAAAELVCEYDDLGVLGWSLTELVEAAVRSGQPARASDALRRLSETTRASGTNWALGTGARSRALLSEGETAENLYREAIERLGRTRMRPAVARAHLLYGEWLRREDRRRDARAQLRTAHGLFATMGIEAFEWHLSKVYAKLGVGSRGELRPALASLGQADPQAWPPGRHGADTGLA
jgi:tetratricopeptide (TPR) repeat protein